jgi:hypothetical protein
MNDDMRRVLDLLVQGKISVDEAQQLLEALRAGAARETGKSPEPAPAAAPPRFLKINVHRPGGEGRREKDVNIRVPLALVRGGLRLGALIPGVEERVNARLRESGVDIDLTRVDAQAIESLLSELGQLTIDVNEGGSQRQVRITCE